MEPKGEANIFLPSDPATAREVLAAQPTADLKRWLVLLQTIVENDDMTLMVVEELGCTFEEAIAGAEYTKACIEGYMARDKVN